MSNNCFDTVMEADTEAIALAFSGGPEVSLCQ